jgi:hypothetical protein
MFLWYWGNNQGGVEVDQSCPERSKLRISSAHFEILIP